MRIWGDDNLKRPFAKCKIMYDYYDLIVIIIIIMGSGKF